jgi:endoglycosylceramidase
LSIAFDDTTATFELVFEADPSIEAPTEIFIPPIHYPHGAKVTVEKCNVALHGNIAELRAEHAGRCKVEVSSK